jgi:hypothetical protein
MQPGYKRVIVIWLVSSTGGIMVTLHLIPQTNILFQAYDKIRIMETKHDSEEIYKE